MSRRRIVPFPIAWIVLACGEAAVVEVPAGNYENAVTEVAGGNADARLRLGGNVQFGWLTDGLSGEIDLNGHTLTWDTGNGNERRCNATLTGTGRFVWIGGGSHEGTLHAPGWIGGTSPNTFTGALTLRRGTLALDKPSGVNAFAGAKVVIGEGSTNPAILRWCHGDQLPDDTGIRLTGDHRTLLRFDGHSERCGTLALDADCDLFLGDGAAVVRFAASGGEPWTAGHQLVIHQWNGVPEGGGEERVVFGRGSDGLSDGQLAMTGFMNPGGRPEGLYRAKILSDGELVPAAVAVAPVEPPFPVDAYSDAERRAIYRSDGLAALAEALKAGDGPRRVAFFGDSITWQANGAGEPPETANPHNNFDDSHHYFDQIGRTMSRWGGPRVEVFNYGINGGGVREIEDGTEHTGNGAGKRYQPSFSELIDRQKIDLAVVFVGVNDAWWRNTPPPLFEESMRKIVAAARERDCRVVLATPLCIGELPDGTNPEDATLGRIAERVRSVAAATDATLVDLRTAFIAWARNHNRELKLDGSLVFKDKGLLTYDRVHLTDTGAELVANLIADGMLRAGADFGAEIRTPDPATGPTRRTD